MITKIKNESVEKNAKQNVIFRLGNFKLKNKKKVINLEALLFTKTLSPKISCHIHAFVPVNMH